MHSAEKPSSTQTNTASTSLAKSASSGGALLLAFRAMQAAGVHRHEGDAERALGEQPAEGVGQGEGELPGVGREPGAEHAREQHVAREAEHAADRSQPADGPDIADEAHARP